MKRITLLVSILLLLFSACSEEAREGGSIEKNGEMLLMLDLKVPVSSSTTRALDKDKEDKVQTVDVLVFDEAGIYQYRKSADVTDASFKVYLKKSGEDKHRLVVLANLKNEINSIDPDLTDGTFGVSQHTQKEDILKLITFESTGNWDTDNLAYTALPMWGETVAKEISASTPSNSFGTIYLLRAVARIDVGLDFDQGSNLPQGLSNFVLKSVEIRNSYSQGYAAPLTGKWSSTPEDRLPSIPDPVPAINEDGSKPVYSISDSETGKYGFVHEIYVSEYDNKTAADNDARFCLIIGGLYAGASAPTYYRIDLLDAQNAPLDILRNYHYRINITKVNGPGYGSEDTAFGSEPINMETDVYAWEEGGLNDIESDGQYQLAVDRSSLTLYKEGEPAETVNLYVDHPSGWEIEIPQAYENWLRVSPESGDAKQPVSIAVTATAMTNAADPDRDGYFYIKSGRLKKKITVQQLNSQELSIVVTPSELVFRKSGTPAQTVEIATYPSDATRYFTYIGDFGTTWPWKPADGAADATYSVQPPVNETGQTRTCVVTVHIKDATGVIIAARNFTVKQLATDINFVPTVDALYPAEGGQQQFLVTTDLIDWIMEITDDPKSILSNLDVTQQGPCTDQAYTFELTPNDTYALREAIIKVSSSESDFADRNIVIKQGYNAPAFTDVSASSITLDGTATKTLTFKVNGDWKFTTDAEFDNVVSAITVGGNPVTADETQSGGTATQPQEVTITLAPKTDIGGTTKLTLTTVTGAASGEDTKEITLNRMAYLKTITYPVSSIPATKTTLAWEISTITDIRITGANATVSETGVSGLNTYTLNPVIAANATIASRDIELTLQYKDKNGNWIIHETFTVTQAGKTLLPIVAGETVIKVGSYKYQVSFGAPTATVSYNTAKKECDKTLHGKSDWRVLDKLEEEAAGVQQWRTVLAKYDWGINAKHENSNYLWRAPLVVDNDKTSYTRWIISFIDNSFGGSVSTGSDVMKGRYFCIRNVE